MKFPSYPKRPLFYYGEYYLLWATPVQDMLIQEKVEKKIIFVHQNGVEHPLFKLFQKLKLQQNFSLENKINLKYQNIH